MVPGMDWTDMCIPMKANPICRVCKVILTDENWNHSAQKLNSYLCKACACKYAKQRYDANPEKYKAQTTRANRKKGTQPFNENKACSSYLGVHIAERVLSHVFKDVEVMPRNNPGYDLICNLGKKIDVKSSCLHADGKWSFTIKHNTTADHFLCLAFDNREDLTPLHAWLLPGEKFSHLTKATISPSTISRWQAYRLDLTKINACCDAMR